jgi:hypothetical protein
VRVVREASGRAGVVTLLSRISEPQDVERHGVLLPLWGEVRCSRSVIRALLVLAAFPADGSPRELTEIAGEIGFSPSTTHRYIRTWVAVGLLEQDLHARRYRRAPVHMQAASAPMAMIGQGADAS